MNISIFMNIIILTLLVMIITTGANCEKTEGNGVTEEEVL